MVHPRIREKGEVWEEVETNMGRRLRKVPAKEERPGGPRKPNGPKGPSKKSPLFWIFSILVVISVIGLYALNSGKGGVVNPSNSPIRMNGGLIPANSLIDPAGFRNKKQDAVSLSKEFIPPNPIHQADQNQVTKPEDVNISLDDTMQKASRALVFIKSARGSGSGFLLSKEGIIITNAHILGKKDEAEVFFASGAEKRGVVLKKLPLPLDIAFLQIDGKDFETLPLADSDLCQEGEEVITLGFSGGGNSGTPPVPSKGSIRNCNEAYEGVQYLKLDKAINQENDGGPIINKKGEVIGLSKGEFSIKGLKGSGFGMAINVVKASMNQKLFHLEDKIKENEKYFKFVYDDLWVILSREYQLYQKKLYELHVEGAISTQEADLLEKRPLNPPTGYLSLKNWVADLSDKLVKKELTKEKATSILKDHFAQ